MKIAIEVEMSAKNPAQIIENANKCVRAGFDKIIFACKTNAIIKKTQKLVESNLPEKVHDRFEYKLLASFIHKERE